MQQNTQKATPQNIRNMGQNRNNINNMGQKYTIQMIWYKI